VVAPFVALSSHTFAEDGAAPANVLTPHRVAQIQNVAAATISPDGKRVAYALSVPRKVMEDDDGPNFTELWIVPFDGGEPRAYVTGKTDVSNVQWLPDSSAIAFTRKRGDDKGASLYVLAVDGGEARRAVASPTGIGAYSIAPDGKRVAFTSTDPDSDA